MEYQDRTKELAKLQQLNKDDEKLHRELTQTISDDYDNLRETQKSLHFLEGDVRSKELEARVLNNNINNRFVQIKAYTNEQALYERQQSIQEIVEQHPPFLHLVELHYKDVKDQQDTGKALPLEGRIDVEGFVKKLKNIEHPDYVRTHGMDKAYLTLEEFKRQYNATVEGLAEEHVDGIDVGTFSFKDFEPVLRSFTKNEHIRRYLGV